MEIKHELNLKTAIARKVIFSKGERGFHWHEKSEIVICKSKSFSILIDGINYELSADDIAFISDRTVHKFSIDSDDTEMVIIQLSSELLLKTGEIYKPLKPFIKKEEVMAIPGLYKKLESIFDILIEEEAPEEKDYFTLSMYSSLYFLLMRYFPWEEKGKSAKKEVDDFYKTVEYINNHFTENITVLSIAKQFYTDRGRLSKIFLKYSGMSLNDYINSLRLAKAGSLIEKGMKITEAALESGFQSLKTYNNVKKRRS